MRALAWNSMDRCAEVLDFFRSRTLRFTMQLRLLRPFFYKRWLRLGFLFILSATSSLALSLFFPLWLLLFGPLVYGVPHIFSSLRYFHYVASPSHPTQTQKLGYLMAGLVLLLVFAHRLLLTQSVLGISVPQLSEWKGSTYIDLFALSVTFVLGTWIYRKSWRQFLAGTAFLAPLVIAFGLSPMITIGAMVLIHNFVAFAFWIRSAQTPAEKRVAWYAMTLTFAVSAAIFLGVFDPVYRQFPPRMALTVAELTAENTGRLIAPWWAPDWMGSELFWLHACSVYAFGQALHYFVWLKAIPDQMHRNEVPTTFKQSLQLLSQDFGKMIAALIAVLAVASVVIWSFMTLQEARMIYFCLAGYHGYLEIAGLALSIKLPFLSPRNPSMSLSG
jgi:hypothetical protein